MKKEVGEEIVKRMKEEIGSPLYVISDKFSKPIISLYFIQNDIKEILKCLELVTDFVENDETMLSALWKNIIITYGKIFSKSDDGYSSLEKKDCIKSDENELHDKVISLRNGFIAHRGDNDIENCLLVLNEKRENGNISFEYILPTAIQMGHLISELEALKKLVISLEQIVDDKLQKKLRGIDKMLWKEIYDKGIIKTKPK